MKTSLCLYENGHAVTESQVLTLATSIMEERLTKLSCALSSPDIVRDYVKFKLGLKEHEVFMILFLDSKNRVIAHEELFRGSIASATVYPREVVKRALRHNAAGIVAIHNHPSGCTEPSLNDLHLTKKLIDALALIEVRLVDHLICGGLEIISLAERGEI